jgi:hypothetical protein
LAPADNREYTTLVFQRREPDENREEGGMSNRPARISQAEIERAIRAARKAGATEVEVKMGDGVSIRIPLVPDRPVAESEEIVL